MNPRSTLETLGAYWGAQQRWKNLSGTALEDFQHAKALGTIRWVNGHSGFYRDLWAGHDLTDWRSLPTVDKRTMMDNFSTFNTAGISKDAALEVALRAERERDFAPQIGGLTVGLSSGTSGHRGAFLVSALESAAWAGVILARALHRPLLDLLLHGERIAFFLRANSNLYERVSNGRVRFSYFDLMTPPLEAVNRLEVLQPTVLVAPPSLLLALLRFRPRIAPRQIIAVAETLEPQDRVRLEAGFGVTVGQIYQATEGLIAVSCRCGRLHLMEDIVAVQLEPARLEEPVPSASSLERPRFTPIITDLWRRTQPIIRYRLNDTVQLETVQLETVQLEGTPCQCGNSWRTLSAIEGRMDDTLEFLDADSQVRLVYPDTIRRAVLLASPNILEYAAQQITPNQLNVQLEVTAGFENATTTAVQRSLETELAHYGIRAARLTVSIGIPAQALSLKRRRVTRLIR